MEIRFACPKCGTRFHVPKQNAGKKASCQKCGQAQLIPHPAKVDARVSGRFNLPSLALEAEIIPAGHDEIPEATDGFHLPSFAELTAISIERMADRLCIDDEVEESGPVHDQRGPRRSRRKPRQRVKGLNPLQRIPRRSIRMLLSGLYAFTDLLFLLAIPAFFLFLMCILIDQATWAERLAKIAVACCVIRFVVNGICLVIVPFKYGLLKAIFFFIPPFTFYFMYQHWNTLKKALFLFLNPLFLIMGVALVYSFVPDLQLHTDEEQAPPSVGENSASSNEVDARQNEEFKELGGLIKEGKQALQELKRANQREGQTDE